MWEDCASTGGCWLVWSLLGISGCFIVPVFFIWLDLTVFRVQKPLVTAGFVVAEYRIPAECITTEHGHDRRNQTLEHLKRLRVWLGRSWPCSVVTKSMNEYDSIQIKQDAKKIAAHCRDAIKTNSFLVDWNNLSVWCQWSFFSKLKINVFLDTLILKIFF